MIHARKSRLLRQVDQVSNEWNRGHWHVNGKKHEAARKTALYMLQSNKSEEGASRENELDLNGRNPTKLMLLVASIIQKVVTSLRPKDVWKPSYVLVNRYENGEETVGLHSDHLSELGPRPIIVGLTLGAIRRFDLKRVHIAQDGSVDQVRPS